MNDTGAACAGEFFQAAGGALAPDAPSYVERAADRELIERVSAGELCYVLTPRQMGKSSQRYLKLCAFFPSLPPGRGKVRMGVESFRTMRRSTPTLALPLPGGGNKLVLAAY